MISIIIDADLPALRGFPGIRTFNAEVVKVPIQSPRKELIFLRKKKVALAYIFMAQMNARFRQDET